MQTSKSREKRNDTSGKTAGASAGAGAGKVYPRRTIYVGVMLTRQIEGSKNASARLENMSRRLSLLTSLAAPKLTIGEWAVVVLSLVGGVGIDDLHAAGRVLAWSHAYGDGVQETYGVDAVELARRLMEQGGLVNVAIAEVAERYWQYGSEMDHAERLELMRLVDREEVRAWKADAPRRTSTIREGTLRSLNSIA